VWWSCYNISYYLICVFFFFQAEDGIRDRNVTGVQTCALPISIEEQERFLKMARKSDYEKYAFFRLIAFTGLRREEILPLKWKDRSEERRVGKECRSRGSR